MRLHIAAQPFPSHQGTQAAIAAMLRCERAHGVPSVLVTYPTAAAPKGLGFTVERPVAWPGLGKPSLRSGPSVHKALLNIQLLMHLRRVVRRLQPRVLVAHHVEAATAALLCGGAPVVFFAHTDLAAELPMYSNALMTRPLRAIGELVDRSLCRAADGVVAISPDLTRRLIETMSSHGGHVTHTSHVPVPFVVESEQVRPSAARARLGLDASGPILAYVGNLDAYQGVDSLPAMLSALVGATLLVATESDTSVLSEKFRTAGVLDRVRFLGLEGEKRRALLHAAADVVVVPRRTPGGLPIKLLDALSRGAAVVASPAAVAGLALNDVCLVGELGAAMAGKVTQLLTDAHLRAQLQAAGPQYVLQNHSPSEYLQGMHAAVELAMGS